MRALSLATVFLTACLVSACGGDSDDSSTIPTAPSTNVAFSTTDLRVGTGATATSGRSADVRYTLWIYSASGSDNKGAQVQTGSFNFTVGTGVVAGFSQGVNGMQVGGIRRVVVPPNLGYGNNPPPANPGEPQIRANETLIFEIELLAVR
jgi:FKBP-type peptidyl-prolyl cis-trans isomerase